MACSPTAGAVVDEDISMKVERAAVVTLALLALGVPAACGNERMEQRMSADLHTLNGKSVGDIFPDQEVAALATSACRGDAAAVETSRGRVDPNSRGLEGITPILWAQDCQSLAGVEALLRVGADPNQSTGGRGGFTPVCIAASMPDSAFLALLLGHGGDPNASYEGDNTTALERAFLRGASEGDWTNYYALLDAGVDINRQHGSNTIAEHVAALNHYDKVAELLQRGYRHNLPRLALYVQTVQVDVVDPAQVEWAGRVRGMLEERGVRFPVTPADAGLRPPTPPANQGDGPSRQ
jgi:hypothetical protein